MIHAVLALLVDTKMAHSTADTPHLDMSTAVSDTDRSIVVTIACWLSLIASLIFYGARLNIRWPLKELFGKDDTACTVSTVSCEARLRY